jgi:hypothetical protein
MCKCVVNIRSNLLNVYGVPIPLRMGMIVGKKLDEKYGKDSKSFIVEI